VHVLVSTFGSGTKMVNRRSGWWKMWCRRGNVPFEKQHKMLWGVDLHSTRAMATTAGKMY